MTKMISIDGIQIPESKILELGYTKPKVSRVFIPEKKEKYYFSYSDGEIGSDSYTKTSIDTKRLALGNVFETEEEITQLVDKRQATTRVLNKLRELEGDWEADWNDQHQEKCLIAYTPRTKNMFIAADYLHTSSPIEYHSTKEAWEYVMDNMREDLKLMFGIE